MRKISLLFLVITLMLSSFSIASNAEAPVIKVAADKTTKILMAVQYTEYKDNSEDANLSLETSFEEGPYFDNVRIGDSFTYTIDVKDAGKYNLRIEFGWLDETGKYTVKVDGTEVGVLQNTVKGKDWRVWEKTDALSINLSKGQHTLTVVNGTAGPNLKSILLTPENKDVNDSSKTVNLFSSSAEQEPYNFKAAETESMSIQFTATAAFNLVEVFAPNWNATAESEHILEFKLFKWDESYAKTIAGTPVASKAFPKYGDGRWLFMPTKAEAGEYVLCLYNNGTANSGIYVCKEASDAQRLYINDVEKTDKSAARFKITYFSSPEKDYGELSPVEAPPATENPQTNDVFVIIPIVLVTLFALVLIKKQNLKV